MRENQGLWRTLARQAPAKLERVLNDLEFEIKEGRDPKNRAAYAMALWQSFS